MNARNGKRSNVQRSRREHTLRLNGEPATSCRRTRSICYLLLVSRAAARWNAGSAIVLVNPGSARAAGRRGRCPLHAGCSRAAELVGCQFPLAVPMT
ncbi:MAG: hypothetical protein ACLVJH_03800 [Faecalibacterium prausnitzii]